MSTFSGRLTGEGTLVNQRTGRRQTYRSSIGAGHIQRANAAANRCGQWAFDANQVRSKNVDGLVRQPVTGLVESLLAGQDLFPFDRLAVLSGRSIEDQLGGGPYVHASAVALDEGNDWLVRDLKYALGRLRDDVRHMPLP